MITITAPLSPATLRLGKQGENAARQIVFDISGWVELYGTGTAVLLHQRSGDSDPYPITVEQDDSSVTWTVSNVDTGVAGKGGAELQYMVGETLAKSVTYRTYVVDALGEATDPPDAYETWLDSLTTLAGTTQTNAAAADASATSAEESAAAAAESAESAAASAEAAATSEDKAEEYAELAEQSAAQSGYFYVDGDEDGSLYFVCTDNVEDISLEDDGSGGLEVVYGS